VRPRQAYTSGVSLRSAGPAPTRSAAGCHTAGPRRNRFFTGLPLTVVKIYRAEFGDVEAPARPAPGPSPHQSVTPHQPATPHHSRPPPVRVTPPARPIPPVSPLDPQSDVEKFFVEDSALVAN